MCKNEIFTGRGFDDVLRILTTLLLLLVQLCAGGLVLFVKFMRWQFDRRAAALPLLLHLMFLSGQYLRFNGRCLHDPGFPCDINIYLLDPEHVPVREMTGYCVIMMCNVFSKWMD